MDIAQTCNYKVGQFTITFGWQDAPLALRTLAEVLKQNILIGMKICQKASKYLKSYQELSALQRQCLIVCIAHLQSYCNRCFIRSGNQAY